MHCCASDYACLLAKHAEDGTKYTPRSIAQMFAGLECYINDNKEEPIRLVDLMNLIFKPLHPLLDRRYHDMYAQGIRATRRQSKTISIAEENQLWETHTIGTESPQALLFAVFYYNGLNFVLRGGAEHRELKISQLKFSTVSDPDDPGTLLECVEYTEHGSKNRPGGRHQLNVENKVVVQYAQPDLGERCHVYLLRLYLSKLPKCAIERDLFYWKACSCIPDDPDKPWFINQPIGHNTLDVFLRRMFESAGIDSASKTNHSLWATAISRMLSSNVATKLMMERSGHLSKEGLTPYERTTAQQHKALCKVISDTSSPEVCKQDEHKEVQAEVAEKKPLKNLQFENMQGCTFNINVQL